MKKQLCFQAIYTFLQLKLTNCVLEKNVNTTNLKYKVKNQKIQDLRSLGKDKSFNFFIFVV